MLGARFEQSMVVNAHRVAIESADGSSLTYADLDRWSAAVAGQLLDLGVGPGDVVALLVGNRPEFVVCDVAIARCGAAKLPVNPHLPASVIAYLLEHSGARIVVVDPALRSVALAALEAVAAPPTVIGIDGLSLPGDVHPLAQPTSAPADPPTVPVDPGRLAALFYTGGTTGRPKGVRHTAASLTAFHDVQLLEAEIRQQDRLLLMTPLAHAAGLFTQSALLRGATVLLRSGFDATDTARAIQDSGVTWMFLVPTMLYRLLDAVDADVDLRTVSTIVYGAAPISPTRLRAALDRFGPVFVQLYGQTECPNWGTRLVKTDHDLERAHLLTSCGQASLRAEVKIVDDGGDPVAVGEVGEICLRSDYLLEGYHGDEQATREKFLGDWIRTGDIGVLDAQGYLYLKDRRADMIISGGMNVYGKEVEDALIAHPDVRAVAVIGVPHDDWGEAVHAVVVADPDLDVDALIAWTRGRLASYARPKSISVQEGLPETPLGKVDKVALRRQFWGARDRAIN